jgi:hypothetical protein
VDTLADIAAVGIEKVASPTSTAAVHHTAVDIAKVDIPAATDTTSQEGIARAGNPAATDTAVQEDIAMVGILAARDTAAAAVDTAQIVAEHLDSPGRLATEGTVVHMGCMEPRLADWRSIAPGPLAPAETCFQAH